MKLPWFLPETLDVIGLLREQAAVTIGGLEALTEWAAGESAAAERVREFEHAADERKLELLKALTASFTTPIDAEDVFTMSERLDAVMNGAKDAVREAEVMDLPPDEHVLGMAGSCWRARGTSPSRSCDSVRVGRSPTGLRPMRQTRRSRLSGSSSAFTAKGCRP